MKDTQLLAFILISTLFLHPWARCDEEINHQNEKQVTLSHMDISLVLAPGDSAALVSIIGQAWRSSQNVSFPRLVAMQPGPLDLAEGLRLLPNEIPPKLTTPQVLIISNLGKLELTLPFLAFVRRCLQEGSRILVIGSFPSALLELPLSPGQSIERLSLDELAQRLNPS